MQIGGYDVEKYCGNQTNITWNSLVDVKYWSVRLSAVSIGEEIIPITANTAIIDTGTSYLVVPRRDLTSILSHFTRKDLVCGPDSLSGLH